MGIIFNTKWSIWDKYIVRWNNISFKSKYLKMNSYGCIGLQIPNDYDDIDRDDDEDNDYDKLQFILYT